jgi:transmembrane sensor
MPQSNRTMESREHIEQLAAKWIARRDSGPWTEADAIAFEEWLAQSVAHRAAYYRLNSAWTEAGRVSVLGKGSAESGRVELRRRVRTRRSVMGFAIAASVLMLVVAALFLFQDQILHRNRFTTVIGGLQSVPMADGSRVTLNTDSQLHISLGERVRVIDLDRGEAFFEVAHDPNRPFIVEVGNRRVIAIGTQFSVRREGDVVRVIVSEGTVRLEAADVPLLTGEKPALPASEESSAKAGLEGVRFLSAGTVARVSDNDVVIQKHPLAEIEQSLTWRSGVLTFRNTPLTDAVAELNRYNSRQLVIEDPAIAALEVGGVFRATNLDTFVHLLEQGFPISANAKGDRIILTSSAHHP